MVAVECVVVDGEAGVELASDLFVVEVDEGIQGVVLEPFGWDIYGYTMLDSARTEFLEFFQCTMFWCWCSLV